MVTPRKPRKLEKKGIFEQKEPCEDPRCPAGREHRAHERCIGHVRVGTSGAKVRPCDQYPVAGILRCRRHGRVTGKTESDARLMAAAVTFGSPLAISPHAALLEELYRTNGHVAWLANKIGELDERSLVWGTASQLTRPLNTGKDGEDETATVTELKEEARPSQWYALYISERKHLASVAEMCVRANIAEREIRVIEAQAVVLAQVIQLVISDARLGIDAPPAVQSQVVRDAMDRMELLEHAA
jgi:hypothetical protein